MRIRASDTRAMLNSPAARRGATRWSQRAPPGARTARPCPSTMVTRSRLSGSAIRIRLVRLHDPLHQRMPDDVLIVEKDDADAFHALHHAERFDEPGHAARRQVDLRDVAGNHRLRSEAEARQEHLHLLG